MEISTNTAAITSRDITAEFHRRNYYSELERPVVPPPEEPPSREPPEDGKKGVPISLFLVGLVGAMVLLRKRE